jgi:alcohol dehydrogenase
MPQIDGFVITAKPAVHFGPGAIGQLPGVVRAVGASQVVVVTDAALAAGPVIETVLNVLADAGLPARVFAGVHPAPTPGDLADGADVVAQASADAATTAAASASAAAVAAMLRPSAPLQPAASRTARSGSFSYGTYSSTGPASGPAASSTGPASGPAVSSTRPASGPAASSTRPASASAASSTGPASPSSAGFASGPAVSFTGFASGPAVSVVPASPPPGPAGPRIVLVAVGGGAPIDAAKGIAIAAVNPQRGRDLDCRHDLAVPALPIVAVPTTAGPGAETRAFGLVTDPADGQAFPVGHASTMPAAAILDPDLTAGLPPAVTAAHGLDALTRALESYLSPRANPWSDGIALQVIRMVAASLPRAVMDGADTAARSQLLLAAHMAGVATASTGLGLCRAIGGSLGARWDIARGAALALLLPEVLRFNLPARLERMADVAFALGVGDTHADTWPNAEAAIGAITALRDDVGLNQRLRDFGITEADFPQITADTLSAAPRAGDTPAADTLSAAPRAGDTPAADALAGAPRPPTAEDIHAILLAVVGQPR